MLLNSSILWNALGSKMDLETSLAAAETLLCWDKTEPGGGVLPILVYTGRLRPKGVPFSGFRYIKG